MEISPIQEATRCTCFLVNIQISEKIHRQSMLWLFCVCCACCLASLRIGPFLRLSTLSIPDQIPENDLELVEISIVTAKDDSFRPLKTLPAGDTR